MMDTIFFVVSGQELYIADYYQATLKKIPFKDKDYWEVYDVFDLRELVEFMNYPLNYKAFKDNKVCIVYDEPRFYEMLYHERALFEKAQTVETGYLTPCLYAYCEAKAHFDDTQDYRIRFENTYYHMTNENGVWQLQKMTSKLLEDVTEEALEAAHKVTAFELCTYLIEAEVCLQPWQQKALILAPATFGVPRVDKGKSAFLETSFYRDKQSMRQEGAVSEGDVLFTYTQEVRTLFGRKTTKAFEKRATKTGIFFPYKATQQDTVLPKGTLMGVIGEAGDTSVTIEAWLKAIGYSART